MKENRKRYLVIMALGTVINFMLYGIARAADLPILMNSVGTGYVAMMLEPAAGLLVGYVYNFFEALLVYGPVSMIYYSTTAVTAIGIGVLTRREGRLEIRRLPGAVTVVMILNTVISGLITIWRTGGDLTGGWESGLMCMLMEKGAPEYVSYFAASFALRLIDAVVLLAMLVLLYRLTPERLKR